MEEFVDLDSCFTAQAPKWWLLIASNCLYHHPGMQYKKGAEFFKMLHPQMCQFIVSYAPLLFLVILPPCGNIIPSCITYSVSIRLAPMPGQLLVQIFIIQEEEKL